MEFTLGKQPDEYVRDMVEMQRTGVLAGEEDTDLRNTEREV